MKNRTLQKILLTAAAVALLTVTALAAVHLLTADQVADIFQQPLLAEAFRSEDAVVLNEAVETGDYRVTLVGLVSGTGLNRFQDNLDTAHTYAVVALEKLVGEPLDEDAMFRFTMTPLVSGYTPWSVNMWSLDSGAHSFEQDGVHYRLLDIENLEMFADHTVYLAFYEGGAPSIEVFGMDTEGAIFFQKDFTGPQALFTLPLDAGKADPAAAQAFVESTGISSVYDPDAADEPLTAYKSEDGTIIIAQDKKDTVWFTAETYAAYMAEETERLRQQVKDGILSQENFDKTVAEMEKTLTGLQNGTAQAARTGENGVSVLYKGDTDYDLTMTPTKDGVGVTIQ